MADDQAIAKRSTIGTTDFDRPVYCLMGLVVDAVTMREAIERLNAATILRPCFLSTPNLNFLVASQTDSSFRDSILRSDLSTVDGMPLIWIARLLHLPIPERVSGADLFSQLLHGAGRSFKLFFFGGPEGIARAACERLNAISPSLRCVGHASPGYGTVGEMSSAASIAQINDSGADFVVVALGAKKGQAWIEQNRGAVRAAVISHLGAVINFVAGSVSRAPVILQRLGLEWLWRIKEEPSLWKRYRDDAIGFLRLLFARVLPILVHRALSVRRAGSAFSRIELSSEGSRTRLTLEGTWTARDLPLLRRTFASITRQRSDIELDLSNVSAIDEAFIGLLMLLYGHQSKAGLVCCITSASSRIRRTLKLNCAEFLL
jgi:N-acetylglucosaminyldiphosphoundecaprenol N-acetyl-beta-D-mannosaminyltransferase